MPSLVDEVACLRRELAEREQAPQDSPSPVVSEPTSPPPVASNAVPRTMGAEQVASARAPRPSTEAETVRAVVVAASDDPRGLLTVQLDNGQAWQQTERTGVPLRASWVESKQVEISRSGFGGYRLRFPEKGRQFAVRRLR
jgi:hypothetical protein